MKQAKRKRQTRLMLLLCACLVFIGSADPVRVLANMDPDVIAKAREKADAAAEGSEIEDYDDDSDGYDEVEDDDSDDADEDSVVGQYQNEINNIKNKLEENEKKQKELSQSINATKGDIQEAKEVKDQIDQQIYNTRSEITLLREHISLLEESIIFKEQEISSKQREIDDNYELFKVRLRAMQVNDDSTTLGLIFGADDFGEFLSYTETVKSIAEHDRNLMDMLSTQRADLESAKEDLEETRTSIEGDRQKTQEKERELAVQLNAAQAEVQNLERLQQEYMANLAKSKAEAEAMQRDLEKIYQQIEWSKNPYVGGVMAWPVPNFYQVSSPYGWRWNKTNFHTGMDIAGGGIYGNKIVAANDGTVRFTNWSHTPGSGYGIYLIVDHGGGTSTLYGHCSNLLVNTGDEVKKGQPIAEVGSTGWSTGPHLHFEVRENGVHKNPAPYVTG